MTIGTLDCNTPKGREWITHQNAIAEAFARGADWIITPDNAAGDIDALYADRETHALVAVAEIKARDMSLRQLERFGSYLVTWEKLQKGAAVAAALAVPYYLVVGLVPDRRIVYWEIIDERGRFLVEPDVRQTRTQATCNGGEAFRANAYLPLDQMEVMMNG